MDKKNKNADVDYDEESLDKLKASLKDGDVIRFYDSFSGGFKLGIVKEMKLENDCYNSKLNIWRPVTNYYLGSPGVRSVSVIQSSEDAKSYEKWSLESLLEEAKEKGISFTFEQGRER